VPACTWGIRHLDDQGFNQGSLMAELRGIAIILAVDARTLERMDTTTRRLPDV